ncbi:MAG: hypothetical protein LBS35_00360 [Synergistaceae bacterium]|nr:hypothetical protein [Synergistaceae bacterium]
MRIQGSNTGKTDTLTLISAQNDALRLLGHGNPSGSNLTVQDIKLKAAGHSPTSKAASPGRGGYAGIWVTGSVTIGDADVEASGISEVNEDDAVFGILAGSSITIQGNSVVVADGNQTGTPNGGRAAGIFSMNGSIMTNATSSVPKVTATAVSASAAAAGIYSEYGSVYITGTTVEATAESKSGGTDKNEGIGIAAGGAIEIYATSTVNATGTSARGESAGIAAAVPGNDSTITTPAGNVKIQGNATVTAEGVGGEGHGIVVEKAGNVEIGTGATVTATAHGTGYAIETATGTITNNGTATLMADDETHYSNTTIGGTGTTTESPNTPPPPPARSSRGGCDAGFGSFAALFALGMSLAIRRKRP